MKKYIAIFSLLLANIAFAQKKRPNILIINVDDWGWRDAGFMGSKYYETPVMDALVKQGTIFTNGYASASNCAPSRASMLSGLWQTRHGIYTVSNSDRGKSINRKLVPTTNNETLDPKFKIFPAVLKENGYTTCIAGKWHMSNDPMPYGFDVNIGGSHAGHPGSYYPPYKNVKLDGRNDKYLTDLIMDKTIDFVNSTQSDKPFLLYYATYAVHTPIQKIDSLMYKFINKPEDDGQKNAEYATMVNNVDRNIGRLLVALKAKGVLDNTLIIFTSDNGGLLSITANHPLRAGKGSYYEGGTRVPLAFIWPGKIKAGTTSDIPVTNMDFYPTIMDAVGIKKYPNVDGNSIYNYLLTQKNTTNLMDRSLFWYFPIYLEGGNKESKDTIFRTRPGQTLRKGDWKLHRYFEDNSIQLYNLKDDIGEKNNLATKNPIKTKELLAVMDEWNKKNGGVILTALNNAYEKK